MRIDGLLLSLAILFVISTSAAQSQSEFLGVGDPLPGIALQDQHDEERLVDSSTRILLFSRDMAGGKLLQEALADTQEGFLASRNAVYIADISGMPSLIARLFAIPKMRKRPYAMLLDRNGDATRRIPDVEEKATLIFLDGLTIERVEHVESVDAVRTLLGLEPPSDQAE